MTTPKQRAARVTRTVRDFRTGIIDREKTAIGSLVQAYDAAYQSLIDELTAATENAQRAIDRGDPVVNTWRVNRAVELTRQAEQLLQEIARQGGTAIAEQRRGAARDAFKAAGKLLDAVMGEPPESFPNASSFMEFPAGAIEQLTGTLSRGPLQELLDDAAEQGAVKAGKILTGAIVTGTHPDLIAGALREALDTSMYRASLIARTEINRTYREALRATMVENQHITPKWRWRSARSLTTCASCFPAGTMVSAAGVQKVFARHYVGDMIIIKTAAGKELTATPNHPILTRRGWVAAGLIQKGDDVISRAAGERAAPGIDVDDQQMPVRIEQVAAALGMVPAEVECASPDFHGDGEGSDVYVVWTHRLLGDTGHAALPQIAQQAALSIGRPRVLTGSSTDLELLRRGDSSFQGLRIGSGMVTEDGYAFSERQARTAECVALGKRASLDASDFQAGCNGRAGNAELLSQPEFSLTREIAAADLFVWESKLSMSDSPEFLTGLGGDVGTLSDNSALVQDGKQSLVVDVIPTSDDLRPLAGDVIPDRVLNVSVRRFEGHVFNLQTETGWYLANGLIVHNCWAMDGSEFDVEEPMGSHPGCRCALEPVPISWADLAARHGLTMPPGDHAIPPEPTGPEAFAELPAEQQQRILDPGRQDGQTPRWDAWNAGQVQLQDFVHTSHSDDWGTTRRESGLAAALERSKKRNGGNLPGRAIEPKPNG